RQTQVADTIVRSRSRWPGPALAALAAAALLGAGGWHWSRATTSSTESPPDALRPEGSSVAADGTDATAHGTDGGLAMQRGADAATAPPDSSLERRTAAALAQEPVPPPRPVRPAAMGTVTVNANPWGTVLVNGKPAGPTPLLRYPVRAGPATVTVENPKLGRKVVQVRDQPRQDTPLFVDLRDPVSPK
ncbi:MAG: PEGA domain-containing protein, partial [Deltaproteobacteria bacterium]|nr:PEGA domain-containing protein [Deltaproteobacteria bacterium]